MRENPYPAYIAGEREMLDEWLDWHRETLLLKCQGLSDEQLRRRPVPPSTLSLLGLVRHMANVERSWFRRHLAGEDIPHLFSDLEEFAVPETATWEEACGQWREEVTRARKLARCVSLDTLAKRGREGQALSLRWIMTHMIEEYARHNGHADLLRERVDGMTGDGDVSP
ncbi:DinB family protein [Nonomuraea sp. LPB2021202275-12-8]|uniref:DinB family protein n=1 Tax=Nonomuraea sp. LPB2021202275-12-8 TaxID=3120159 RepID=UPI00300C8CEB